MVNQRPTWLEVRNLFPTGFLALIALLIADATVPTADLWHKSWFVISLLAAALLILIGLFGFVAHYVARSIPLVLIAAAAVAVLLHWPPFIFGGFAVAAFLTTLHFLSAPKPAPTTQSGSPPDGSGAQKLRRQVREVECGDSAHVQRDTHREQIDVVQQQGDDAQHQVAEGKSETATAQPFLQAAASLPPYEVPDSFRDEIGNRFPGRSIINYSVIDLTLIAKNNMTAHAQRLLKPIIDNNWKIITGEMMNFESYADNTTVVRLKNALPNYDILLVSLSFDGQPWLSRIEGTPKSTTIIAMGEIKKVDAEQISLEHCELV